MKTVELYARVRHAVLIEGISECAAADRFGINAPNGFEDVEVLGASGIRAREGAVSAQARRFHGGDRYDSVGRQGSAEEAAAYEQADLQAAPG